jgi:hypothetical protein
MRLFQRSIAMCLAGTLAAVRAAGRGFGPVRAAGSAT